MSTETQAFVTMRIDGRTVHAREGSFLLETAQKAGIHVPALCNHPDLEPIGACRLCMVEVTHPDWNGWSGLMTACLYPVKEGLEISTNNDNVRAARRGVLSLLLARCPNSDIIRKLSEEYGARADGLTSDPDADNCIVCGLCTRVCETFATGAITTAGRGVVKTISSFSNRPPADCIGCGACVSICPTHVLHDERTTEDYRVWDRTFPTHLCSVDESACIGCGSCEEACPFDVPRVVLRAAGLSVATIPPQACRGCGACMGACPTGAITQQGLEPSTFNTSSRKVRVFSCTRSNLQETENTFVQEMPCVGRITVPLLLHAITTGAKGVLVLGRHQSSCRLNGAEDPVKQRVRSARRLLELLDIDPHRIRFEEPHPGLDGPRLAVDEYLSFLPSEEMPPTSIHLEREGLDDAWKRFDILRKSKPLNGTSFLAREGLPKATSDGAALLAGKIPVLHILGEELFAPTNMTDSLHGARQVLSHLGMTNVGVQVNNEVKTNTYALETTPGAVLLDDLLRSRGSQLPRPAFRTKVGVDGSDEESSLVAALGYEPVDVGKDPLPSSFLFSTEQRARALDRLLLLEKVGAYALLVRDPFALARWAILTRSGAWKSSRVLPFLGVELAHLSLLGKALGRALGATKEKLPTKPLILAEVTS